MLALTPPRVLMRAAAAVLAALAVAACAGATPARSAETTPTPAACAGATQATVAAVDATVAEHIYLNELAGREVNTDIAHVTAAKDLLAAVAHHDLAATKAAVLRLIFHPHWHIVRLVVFDRAGNVLSDIGGAYTIAPVAGVLKSGSHTIGRFLMSVQDDTGETKLETRLIGNPVAIYVSGALIAQRFGRFPASLPHAAAITLGHHRYMLVRETFKAFPHGTLVEVMAVPAPATTLATQPCAAVRAAEFGRVAQRLAALASDLPHQYPAYASTVAIFTGVNVFVRRGREQLGTSGGPGPANPPGAGTVTYNGLNWLVYTFQTESDVVVYLLIQPA